MSERLRHLILLLRSHLFDFDAKASFPTLSENEWSELYELALSHGVQGFAYEGAYRAGITIPPALKKVWHSKMMSDIQRYYRQYSEYLRILAVFNENNIHPVILKGLSVSHTYPIPELRVMGDTDILISDNFYEAALLLEQMGYRTKKEVAIHHIEFVKDNFLLELHRTPFTPTGYKDYDRLIDAVNFSGHNFRFIELSGVKIPVLNEDDFINMSFEHILKHLTHDRMALRNICDILMLFRTVKQSSWQDYYKLISDCGLAQHFSGLISFLVYELGLPQEAVSGIRLLDKSATDAFAKKAFSITTATEGASLYYSSLGIKGTLKMLSRYLAAVKRDMPIKYPYSRKNIFLRLIGYLHAYLDYAAELIRKMFKRNS